MSAIGKAIGPLANIALLLLFAIIIFAIIGLEFYGGALNSACYDISDLSKLIFLILQCYSPPRVGGNSKTELDTLLLLKSLQGGANV